MYQIIKDGAVIAMAEDVNWIRLQDNGCFGLCVERDAQGVALNGAVYHVYGKPEIDLEGIKSVVVASVDAGEIVNALKDTPEGIKALQDLGLVQLGAQADIYEQIQSGQITTFGALADIFEMMLG